MREATRLPKCKIGKKRNVKSMRNLLVTGGAGFIGSNFLHYVLNRYKEIQVVNLDALTYAGNLENLEDIAQDSRYTFVKGDICDRKLVEEIFRQHNIDTVVNFAAETHVDRSIVHPEQFLASNIMGTQVLLEAARKSWGKNSGDKYSRHYKSGVKYLQVSTDEVYGALGKTGMFTEHTPIAPRSPYSASKAGADLMVQAYYETYGLPVQITRCSNNYGPYQFPEKLIPLMIYSCCRDIPLPIYGDGLQVRDWLYVEDHCAAICAVLERGTVGEVYNIGGNNEKTNLEIVRLLISKLGKTEDMISYVMDRPGHDRRYAVDSTKIISDLGWKPQYDFQSGMMLTIRWYQEHLEWLERITSGQYQAYYSDMYGST